MLREAAHAELESAGRLGRPASFATAALRQTRRFFPADRVAAAAEDAPDQQAGYGTATIRRDRAAERAAKEERASARHKKEADFRVGVSNDLCKIERLGHAAAVLLDRAVSCDDFKRARSSVPEPFVLCSCRTDTGLGTPCARHATVPATSSIPAGGAATRCCSTMTSCRPGRSSPDSPRTSSCRRWDVPCGKGWVPSLPPLGTLACPRPPLLHLPRRSSS